MHSISSKPNLFQQVPCVDLKIQEQVQAGVFT